MRPTIRRTPQNARAGGVRRSPTTGDALRRPYPPNGRRSCRRPSCVTRPSNVPAHPVRFWDEGSRSRTKSTGWSGRCRCIKPSAANACKAVSGWPAFSLYYSRGHCQRTTQTHEALRARRSGPRGARLRHDRRQPTRVAAALRRSRHAYGRHGAPRHDAATGARTGHSRAGAGPIHLCPDGGAHSRRCRSGLVRGSCLAPSCRC